MNLFKFLKNQKEEGGQTSVPVLPAQTFSESNREEIEERELSDRAVSNNTALSVSYATGWPIDLIYGNLHKNYEDRGYADAMLNSNLSFRDMNMSIIRNKILMIFREVNLKYNGMQQDLETRIQTCNAAGLLTTVAELEKQMSVILAHKTELTNLETDFRNNANEASVPLMSYECGFLRGVSAIAMSAPAQSTAVPEVTMASFFNTDRETA